jgi:NhaA family Na+:H+ antiporter
MAQAQPSSGNDILPSIVLLAAAVAALVVANSPLATLYKSVLDAQVGPSFGGFGYTDEVKDWIKNALMAIFFVLVGLEIKAEFREGSLAERSRAILPFLAALGGMVAPAIVYLVIIGFDPATMRGWAIPCATDIAFAVGVLGLLGRKIVPPALTAFLLAVAVIDDLGAIIIIALFYTDTLNVVALGISFAIIGGLYAMLRMGVTKIWAYLAVGLALWVAILQSGVNPTLAGVITALFVPLKAKDGSSPLHDLAHALKPWVAFLIMPVFAFANAGVPVLGLALADLFRPVTVAIAMGLLIGKPIGIAFAVWLSVKAGIARLPEGVNWTQVVGVGFIAGIGFTMSLFIGALAFETGGLMDQVRLGVLSGSFMAAICGVVVLILGARRPAPVAERRAA